MARNLPNLYLVLSVSLLFFLFSNTAKSQGTNRVDIGKSYANLSKIKTGGTFNPGDTVEIRVTIAVITQASIATSVDRLQVFDTVPAKTTYIAGSLRLATNEGVTYKTFTDAANDDPGTITGNNIVMNLGAGATPSNGGAITSNTSRPSFYNSHCITMACYRVKINAAIAYGDSISIGGKAVYRLTAPSASTNTVPFPTYKLLIFSNSGYCSNGLDIPVNSDSLGTFGSGTLSNRTAALTYTTTYVKQTLTTGNPQDYFYAIVQNSSPDSSTNVNSAMPEATATKRVFGIWDICGDHTGAISSSLGNPPPAGNVRGGYMVLVNASYRTDVAYQETLSGLCPNTYYEFSAWFRNLCPRCGCDSTGKGSGSFGYITGPGNDSSGVHPNLNFEIDGLAYFSSGDIKYDRAAPWKKFGFTFITKPGQTTAQFVIRNNSPGGGGNDWAVDDIKVSHCGPTLKMNYSPVVTFCKSYNYPLLLADTVRYLYTNSYVNFKWQQSNIGGTIWSDMTGPGTSGTGAPTMVNGQWEYVTSLPWFFVTGADSGRYYRVLVATTAGNLNSPTCGYTDGSTTMVKAVTCGSTLTSNFTQFHGEIVTKNANLTWIASLENNLKNYEVERSVDGTNFNRISSLDAKNISQAHYLFIDPDPLSVNNFYRIKIVDNTGNYKYSNTILLTASLKFDIKTIINPFTENINADVIIPMDGLINIRVFNDKGQLIKSTKELVKKGSNGIIINNLGNISAGMYFLSVEFKREEIKRKMIKVN